MSDSGHMATLTLSLSIGQLFGSTDSFTGEISNGLLAMLPS